MSFVYGLMRDAFREEIDFLKVNKDIIVRCFRGIWNLKSSAVISVFTLRDKEGFDPKFVLVLPGKMI